MLLSRNNHPPGGFQWWQPQTRWRLEGGLPFNDTVRAILQHRKSNPSAGLSLDPSAIAEELDNYTCARLMNDPRWCAQKKTTNPTLTSSFPNPVPRDAPLVEAVANIAHGAETLVGWLGHGMKAVEVATANDRAKICVTCPMNVQGGFLERVTGAIGVAIKAAMELKEKVQLKTQFDDQLGTCDSCGCALKLKTWVPGPEIKANLQPGDLEQFDQRCWIRLL